MPANWDGRRISAVLKISTQIVSSEPLPISVGSLRFLRAAGYLPAPLVYASPFNITSYNTSSGGGGNCTRSPVYITVCPKCGYDTMLSGWPEKGRQAEALRELVANWHSLTSSVRAKIVDLLRSGCELAR
jgi:hypothetical protein